MLKILSILLVAFIFSCSGNNSEKTIGDKLENLMDLKENEILVASIKTNKGTMELQLFPREVPKTVENFAGLALKGYYNGVIFHRVIDGFMIQGGDSTGTGRGGHSFWGGTFNDEFNPNLKHDSKGILSMANAGPNTNGSQFFITLVPTPWLDGKHSVFGKLISGMDVLEAIGKTPTVKPYDRPVEDIVMEEVTVEKRLR